MQKKSDVKIRDKKKSAESAHPGALVQKTSNNSQATAKQHLRSLTY